MNKWMLTEEELSGIWQQGGHRHPDDHLSYMRATGQAQARKIAEWGDGPCPHGGTVVINYKARSYLRRECPDCWAEFKKEAGL